MLVQICKACSLNLLSAQESIRLNSFYVCISSSRQPELWRDPAGSPSRGGDVGVYNFSFSSSISAFTALSTVFNSMNSPDNFPLSHSVLPVLFLPYLHESLL